MKKLRLCKCGCGEELGFTQDQFRHGHNRRGLVSNTKGEKWSHHYDCCQECGTMERKHQREGLCSACARRAIYHGAVEKKNSCLRGRWAAHYSNCVDCGRVDRPHAAHGRCNACAVNYLNRQKGKPKRNFGAWSWYYAKCINCKTTEIPHAAGGLCDRCYSAKKQKTSNDKICPVCSTPVNRLFQHISMVAKKSEEHQKYLDQQERLARDLFFTDQTSQELANAHTFGKRFILKTWHRFFSEEEIKERGEKIRISKIQGSAHYLHGKPFPLIHPSIIDYKSPAGKVYKMKSSWEAKLAQLFDRKQIEYLYEPEGFMYVDPDGIERHYWPDFYLPKTNTYVEVKGYMDERSEWKIQQFRENNPQKKLVVIESEEEISEDFVNGLDR